MEPYRLPNDEFEQLLNERFSDRIPDGLIRKLLESKDEDAREQGHQLKKHKWVLQQVERESGAERDAYLGIAGAILFAVGGLSGYGLIATGLGLIMFLALVLGALKRQSFKTFLIGIPALVIFGVGVAGKVGKLTAMF